MTPGPCRGRQSIKLTAGPYRQIPFPTRLQGPAVNPQDCRLYERRTPCPAVRTHPARDARDYSPPGPCRPPGTVGNTVLDNPVIKCPPCSLDFMALSHRNCRSLVRVVPNKHEFCSEWWVMFICFFVFIFSCVVLGVLLELS